MLVDVLVHWHGRRNYREDLSLVESEKKSIHRVLFRELNERVVFYTMQHFMPGSLLSSHGIKFDGIALLDLYGGVFRHGKRRVSVIHCRTLSTAGRFWS